MIDKQELITLTTDTKLDANLLTQLSKARTRNSRDPSLSDGMDSLFTLALQDQQPFKVLILPTQGAVLKKMTTRLTISPIL